MQTGQLGTGAVPPRLPEDPAQTLNALGRLKPANGPFVLRLHRFFWSDGEEGVRRFLALKDRYTRAGYFVELQLRYHPDEQQEGDIAAWTAHVRDVVRRFGADPRVVAIQVTNEVNLTFSPDSSDGAYEGAKDALIQGVIAAQDEKRSAATASSRSASTGPTARRPTRSASSGSTCATTAGRGSYGRWTGSRSTSTRARSSRRSTHRAASATHWSTR